MPLNPSIALSATPVQFPDPLANYARVMQIQQAQNQNALAQYQLAAAKRTDEVTNALNAAWSSAYSPATGAVDAAKMRAALAASGYGSAIPGVEKSLADVEKERTQVANLAVEGATKRYAMLAQARRDISGRPSDANIIAHTEDMLASPYFTEQEKKTILAEKDKFLAMPYDDRVAALAGQGATAGERRPHYTPQDLGGSTRVLAMPAFGGPAAVVPGSEAKRTATPGELLVDRRARERLAAESESGEYSPATIEYLASMYNQTGQLPALGIGKNAGAIKMQILDRARQLGTQAPASAPGEAPGAAPTPQEAAEKVVQSKQTRAAEQSTLRAFGSGVEGRSVRSFNTAIDHLDTMSKLATALENGDVRLFNTVANAFAKGVGAAAPTNFDTAKSIVGGEVAKALTGSSMALKDREEIRDAISRANSPAQLAGSVRALQELMGGQLKSLKLQYESGTNRKDFDSRLSARAKDVIKSLEGGAPAATPAAPAAGSASSVTLPDGRTINFPSAAAAAAFRKDAGL